MEFKKDIGASRIIKLLLSKRLLLCPNQTKVPLNGQRLRITVVLPQPTTLPEQVYAKGTPPPEDKMAHFFPLRGKEVGGLSVLKPVNSERTDLDKKNE